MRTTLLTAGLLASLSLFAQERTLQNVLRTKARGGGVIMKSDELAGYYSFYEVDKVDSKTRAFRMALLDNNLNEMGEIKLNRPKGSYLMENVFNGQAFMFFFLNEKNVELETYDLTGKKLGEKVYEDASKWERMRAMQAQAGGDNGEVNQSIFPIGDGGFLKQSIVKGEKRGYQLTAYNNDMSVRWETEAPNSDLIETLDVVAVTKDHIVASMWKQKGAFDMPDVAYMALFDVTNGKKLWEKEVSVGGKRMTVVNVFPVEGTEEMFVIGELFAPDDKVFKAKSQGMYAMRMGLDGVPLQTEMLSWEKDILPHVPADEKGEKDMDRIFFHKVVRLKNGTIHCIGEEYKKAMGATGGVQITTKDMFVIELGPDLKMKRCTVYPKSKTRTEFAKEYAMYSASILAKVVKQLGRFDYEFTTQDKVADRFFSTFVDYDRSKNEDGKKAGTYIGTIVGDGKAEPTLDKYDVDVAGATYFRAMPAKPGFVLVYEYNRKAKSIRFRLEKVNF
ncbi:MAG: hypothetical protein JNM62_00635 [Flavobacteriales bacterium]|nr:hypothetical protein [Flavobacteriales bacterium]